MGSETLDAGKHVKYKMENTINVIAIKKILKMLINSLIMTVFILLQ